MYRESTKILCRVQNVQDGEAGCGSPLHCTKLKFQSNLWTIQARLRHCVLCIAFLYWVYGRLSNQQLLFPVNGPTLYHSGLDENGAGTNLYPACWICSKNVTVPGTNCITGVYNFLAGHQNQLLPGTIFVPGSQVQGTKFVHCNILIFTENYIKQ